MKVLSLVVVSAALFAAACSTSKSSSSVDAARGAGVSFTCGTGVNKTTIAVAQDGSLVFSDKSERGTAQDLNCQPKGQGGTLYVGGSGPNAWGWRLPMVLNSSFQANLVLDEDSDGEACEFLTVMCVRN